MKNMLKNNLLMKIISLFAGVFIWIFVVYNLNPMATKSFTVPVTFINQNKLEAEGQTWVGDTPTIELTVSARSLDIGSISAEDFVVEGDLAGLYGLNDDQKQCNILVKTIRNEDIIEKVEASATWIYVSIEPFIERKFAIVPISDNVSLAPDYLKGKVTVSPSEITIRGRRSDVSRIYQAVVYISGQDVNEGFSETVTPILVDEKQNELKPGTDLKSVAEITSTVTATVPVMLSKSLNISVKATGTPADGYYLREATPSREKINVIGPKEDLKSLSEIVLDPDISNLSESKTETIQLARYLLKVSENIKLADNEENTITVDLDIAKKPTKLYRFDKIEMENKNPLLEYSMTKDTYEIEVEFDSDKVDRPQVENIRVSVNVAGLQIGEVYTFSKSSVNVVLPEGCTLLRKDDVEISVSEKTTQFNPPTLPEPSTEEPVVPTLEPITEAPTEPATPEVPPTETEPVETSEEAPEETLPESTEEVPTETIEETAEQLPNVIE